MKPMPLPDYERTVEISRIIDQCCAYLKCDRTDFPRMLDGLERSVRMLRGELPIDLPSLPKRYRKALKSR